MRQSRSLPLLAAFLTVTVGIGVACSDGPISPPPPPARALTAPTWSRTAAADFHRTNPQDWVGQSHNRAMDAFFKRLATHHGRTDVCTNIRAVVADPTLLPAKHRSERNAAAVAIGDRMLRDLGCPTVGQVGQVPVAAHATVTLASAHPEDLRFVQSTTLSPEAGSLVTQLADANSYATDPTDLANRYNAILPGTAVLSPVEAEVVNATASVGLYSMEYWSANLDATRAATRDAYGTCIQSYAETTDLGTTLWTCMGLAGPASTTLPVRFEGPARVGGLRLVIGACNAFSLSNVLKYDFTGAFAGGIMAAVTTTPVAPVSVPFTAFWSGFGASVGGGLWDAGADIWCEVSTYQRRQRATT